MNSELYLSVFSILWRSITKLFSFARFALTSLVMDKKTRWTYAEDIAVDRLVWKWLRVGDRNRTMRGGELDIVGYMDDLLVVVEVRCTNYADDLHSYTSPQKMRHLLRSVAHRVHTHQWTGAVRLDIVYVKWSQVVQRYQNVTNE